MEILQDLGAHSLGIRLKRASDHLAWESNRLYKKMGKEIEANWLLIFRLLAKYQQLSIMEIAEALNLKHPSVLMIVNKMLKKGYLKQTNHDTDKRKRMISLTGKGEKKMQELEPLWKAGHDVVREVIKATGYPVIEMLESLEAQFREKGFYDRIMEKMDKQAPRSKR